MIERLVFTRGPACQAGLDCCINIAVDAHEILSRARGGSIVDEDNILLLCRPCHDYITTHPAEAEEKGFSRKATPEERR